MTARADLDGEPLWFHLAGASVEVEAAEGSDLTRSVGRLRLDAHVVDRTDALPAPDPDRQRLVINTVLAAEAAGIAGWALDTAVAYVRDRVQFDRPVGSFQAVQHKAAMMHVRSETACDAACNSGTDRARLDAALAD